LSGSYDVFLDIVEEWLQIDSDAVSEVKAGGGTRATTAGNRSMSRELLSTEYLLLAPK
jgi:hypothetical protein